MVACLALLAGHGANAGTNDILIGLDQKITYDANGQVNGPPGKDAVLVMDVSNPAKPRVRASLPLMNSLLGPPANLQITPDGKVVIVSTTGALGLIADAEATIAATGPHPHVIDLMSPGNRRCGNAATGQLNPAGSKDPSRNKRIS